jgi:hypothetical protein
VCFLRRKSPTAHCILHVAEQHIRMEPWRVNREDYATDDKRHLSSVSLAASGFLGPEVRTRFFVFILLVMMTGAAQPRSDSPCISLKIIRLSATIISDMVCTVATARDVAVRSALSACLCRLLATGEVPYPVDHTVRAGSFSPQIADNRR